MYPEKTIHYKTYLKSALQEGFNSVFAHHPDPFLQTTKVTLDRPKTKLNYPALVIKFYERSISNQGVGHQEIVLNQKAKHFLYEGDVEFTIHTLTTPDRDLMADSVVQTITMGNLNSYTNNFFNRIYADTNQYPLAAYNYININTDKILGFGETTLPAPWRSEDEVVYQTSYRSGVFGEFYSPVVQPPTLTYIADVKIYPYIGGVEPVPPGANDPAEWLP